MLRRPVSLPEGSACGVLGAHAVDLRAASHVARHVGGHASARTRRRPGRPATQPLRRTANPADKATNYLAGATSPDCCWSQGRPWIRRDTPTASTVPVRPGGMVPCMGRPAGTPQPRGRGPRAAATTAGRVRVVLYVTPENHDRIHAQALSVGMSIGRYVEALADRDDLDDTGRPAWAASAGPPADVLPLAM